MGAVSGPDIYSSYLSVNGVSKWYYSSALNNASTTLCSFKTPAATTTLEYGSFLMTNGTSTVLYIDMGKHLTSPSATSTGLMLADTYTTGSEEKQFFMASSTDSTRSTSLVFGPGQYLNVRFTAAAAISATTNDMLGRCKAVFVENF